MPGPSVMSLRARMVLYLSPRAVARAIQTMSRPGPKSTSENRRVRALLSSLLCALCCVLPLSSWAGRPVRVYEVDVDGQSAAAVQDAMRQALVRATGRRESADDPALAGVLAEATRYVKSYAVGPQYLGSRAPVHARGAVSAPQSRRRGRGAGRARARGGGARAADQSGAADGRR